MISKAGEAHRVIFDQVSKAVRYCFTSVCDWSRKPSIPCISLVLTAAHILGAGTV